jgi:hypothetical protein
MFVLFSYLHLVRPCGSAVLFRLRELEMLLQFEYLYLHCCLVFGVWIV